MPSASEFIKQNFRKQVQPVLDKRCRLSFTNRNKEQPDVVATDPGSRP